MAPGNDKPAPSAGRYPQNSHTDEFLPSVMMGLAQHIMLGPKQCRTLADRQPQRWDDDAPRSTVQSMPEAVWERHGW